jgi:uncharacterized membrane protein YqiK
MIPIISAIAQVATTWVSGKAEAARINSEAKLATTKAKAAVMEKVAAGELEWNQTMAEASNKSWKDEWLTILVSIPLVLAFTGHEDVVMKGFTALEAMPDFYKTAVGVVFAASFGIQSIKNMMNKK